MPIKSTTQSIDIHTSNQWIVSMSSQWWTENPKMAEENLINWEKESCSIHREMAVLHDHKHLPCFSGNTLALPNVFYSNMSVAKFVTTGMLLINCWRFMQRMKLQILQQSGWYHATIFTWFASLNTDRTGFWFCLEMLSGSTSNHWMHSETQGAVNVLDLLSIFTSTTSHVSTIFCHLSQH